MDFKTAIIWSGRLYKLLEKAGLENRFALDSIIDNHYPQFASKLQTFARHEKIALCATNGKKTMTSLLNKIISENNKTTITNVINNKKYPLLTAAALNLENSFYLFSKELEKDYYTMALDEFEMAFYFNSIKFDYLLLSNLFIDQREFCSLEEKKQKIKDAIVLNSKLNLIINADEPAFFEIDKIENDSILNKKRNKIFYGFNSIELFNSNETLEHKNDFTICPNCNCALDYKKRFYSHLGQYDCECGFRRPNLDIAAEAKIFPDYSFLNVFYNKNKYIFKLPLGGVYNAYNALGVIAVALCLKIERKIIQNAFENYKPVTARDEILEIKNKKIKIKVIKNPVSLSESTRELWGEKNTKVVFCLDDDEKDGIDTSWIWDSNLESLRGFENKIYITSKRCDDMALRLKYALVNPCLMTVDASVKNALQCCFWELEKNEKMLVLSTPSSLNEIYRILNLRKN